MVQRPSAFEPDRGAIGLCYHGPDATRRNGRLNPVCVADAINPLGSARICDARSTPTSTPSDPEPCSTRPLEPLAPQRTAGPRRPGAARARRRARHAALRRVGEGAARARERALVGVRAGTRPACASTSPTRPTPPRWALALEQRHRPGGRDTEPCCPRSRAYILFVSRASSRSSSTAMARRSVVMRRGQRTRNLARRPGAHPPPDEGQLRRRPRRGRRLQGEAPSQPRRGPGPPGAMIWLLDTNTLIYFANRAAGFERIARGPSRGVPQATLKRHEQMKTVFEVMPVNLKTLRRMEALLFIYFLVLLVESLIEREIRLAIMQRRWSPYRSTPKAGPTRRPRPIAFLRSSATSAVTNFLARMARCISASMTSLRTSRAPCFTFLALPPVRTSPGARKREQGTGDGETKSLETTFARRGKWVREEG
jgi:hypothetical protein